MPQGALTRRDFHRLSMAALAGTVAGCARENQDAGDPGRSAAASESQQPAASETAAAVGTPKLIGGEVAGVHACRGLNQCRNLGASKQNECAGQGFCATTGPHTCHYKNDCKYLGGCGNTPASNDCKGKGECAVPIVNEETWKKARAAFEKRMAAQGKNVGPPPPRS